MRSFAAALGRFDPRAFDYIVVDEFHHDSAATYRRIIDHFQPAFLLGEARRVHLRALSFG